MNNSILMLSAGAIIGISGTLLFTDNQAPSASENLSTTNTTAASHQSQDNQPSAELYNQTQAVTGMVNTDDNGISSDGNMHDTMNTSQNFAATTAFSHTANNEVVYVEPTSEQIKQYNSIDARLTAAINNKSVDLSELIQDAENLTAYQRDQLTRKAIQLIHNDELSVSQFSPPPGS